MAERVAEWVVSEIDELRRNLDALKELVDDINGRLINVESFLAHLALPYSSSSPKVVRLTPREGVERCGVCGAEIPKGFLSCPVCHMPVEGVKP